MYENVTYETILERMLDRVSDKLDKREGSIIFDAHSPAAVEFQILYIELDTILREAYGDTASREYLIRRCAERGITPHEATHAVLKGVFSPKSIDVSGQRFNIGALNFEAVEKIADGEYKVRCESAGTAGNQHLGTMTPIDYIDGLETADLTELLIPGEDEEDTEELRSRYLGSFDEKAFGGNVQDYIEKTNSIAGVGSTKVTRVWNSDIRPAELIPSAAVKTWYSSAISQLSGEPAAWLTAVYNAALQKKLTTGGTVLLTILNSDFAQASETLLKTVAQEIDPEEYAGEGYGIAPIGHIVSVRSAESVSVTVKTNITFDSGFGWSNLQTAIESAVEAYFLELRKQWADSPYLLVRISQIETRLLGIRGIVDVDSTKLNGSPDNLTLGQYEIPVFGGISA